MFWLIVGYLFLFVFRPFEYWPILGYFHIERIYMIFLLIAVAIWPERRYINHPINKLILLFLIVMVLSSVLALRPNKAYVSTFDYFKLVVFYFIILMTIQDEEQLKNFLIAYILIMFIYVGKSAWEFFIHDRFLYRMGISRMMGIDITYSDPNSFAASIAYSLPFVWALICSKFKENWLKICLVGYFALALISIIFTGSRSGMVATLLFFVMAWMKTSKKVVGLVVLSFLLIFLWGFMPTNYQIRFKSIFIKGIAEKGADVSAQGRIVGLKQGIRLFKRYPVLGIGPGNFKYGWYGIKEFANAHNLYGQLLGELGAIGFLFFLFLVYKIVTTHWYCIRQVKDSNDEYEYAKFFILVSTASIQVIILLLFNGNFGHNLYRYNWLWIGVIGVLSSHFLAESSINERNGEKIIE